MFIKFNNFRVAKYVKEGETGFSASIYYGTKNVGVAKRKDGDVLLSDIHVKLRDDIKDTLIDTLKRKQKIFIDGVATPWSAALMVLCLIENLTMYDAVKKCVQRGNIVIKLKNEDFFQVLNIPNNPKNVALVKKNHDSIEKFGADFIEEYNEISKFEENEVSD